MIAIKTAHLSKKFKDLIAVNDFSLEVPQGELFALLGITGAGKTTITNLLNRFYDITDGEITYDGIDIKRIKKDGAGRGKSRTLVST